MPDGPGFRRRILIEPRSGRVSAELEDDWHRMTVVLKHDDETITAVDSVMTRRPWTTCPGAIDRLTETFVGVALAQAARRGEKTSNCTHLYDLALFAAAHAGDDRAVAYDIHVSDPVDGARTATLTSEGTVRLAWTIAGDAMLAPLELEGASFAAIGGWIAGLDPALREAARILRWATILSFGRQMTIPAGISGSRFATGACFTFQPDRAAIARRNPDADSDFSHGPGPLADRPTHFPA
ncbi:DUF2889 domain-containing protein [uncultured Sphingomonas sp.]|uniref:DUF2889 domain-containing protein n=1 Tax=uncultured Sphingomonas sp. TaxID=158754 RepID=UPI002612A161|nr:DUF2889 domain-containing protein [uncultured Sphingomonas sp.]